MPRTYNRPGGSTAMVDRYLGAIPGAQQLTNAIGAAGPQDFGQFIEPGLQQAIDFNLNQGGMPQQAFDAASNRIGQGLNQAISRNSVANARRGSYNPGSVASSNRPAFGNFANARSNLETERANLRQRAVTTAGNQLTGLAPIAARQNQAAQEGFGNFLSQLAAGPRMSMYSTGQSRRALP